MATRDGLLGRTLGRERLATPQHTRELVASTAFRPIKVLEVELSGPLPAIPVTDPNSGQTSDRALVLARLHNQPVGVVEMALNEGPISAAEVGRRLWRAVGDKVVDHLQADGLDRVDGLGAAGLAAAVTPRCLRQREALLAEAAFISVVVSTRDRPDLLGRCLPSLLAQEYPRFEVIVVDNAPTTEATAELVRRDYASSPQVRYVREERPGLARARNRGVREAKGELVAFTDDDAVADRHWLAGLARGFALGQQVGCVTGLVMPLALETQAQVWFEEFGGFGRGFESRIYDLGAHRPQSRLFPYSAGIFGSGNNMAFRVAALRAIGGFDPALGAGSPTQGGEDLASFVATIKKGFSLVYEPSALVHHEHRRDFAAVRRQAYGYGIGWTAYLTKCLVDDPASLPGFAAKMLLGLGYTLYPRSPRDTRRHANYPSALTGIERRGMLAGPSAYLRARLSNGREVGDERFGEARSLGRPMSTEERDLTGNGGIPGRATTAGKRPLALQRQVADEGREFRAIRLLEVEISRPLPGVVAADPEIGPGSERALALVRLHTQPLGLVQLAYGKEGLSPTEYARRVWDSLGEQILTHLRRDGLPEVGGMGSEGLPAMVAPPCTRERQLVMEDAPFVSVVVPTRDRPELVRSCLASLAALDYPNYEVLVVDNAPSSDATAAVVSEAAAVAPRVRYLREERPGASWARNRGLREARGEIVAFTDDDATVDRYWLAELVKGFRLGPNVGCVTGNVLPQRLDTPARAWFGERGGFSRGFARQVYDKDNHRSEHPLYPYNAMIFGSGNNMAFRASVLRSIGGFDPALDPASVAKGGEDSAAFFDVIQGGHQLVYEPNAFVRHTDRPDYEGLRRQLHAWGVGFVACLVRCLAAHPRLIPDFALRLPYIAFLFLTRRIPAGKKQEPRLTQFYALQHTQALWQAERSGYLHGLTAYLRSRWHVLQVTRQFGSLPVRQ